MNANSYPDGRRGRVRQGDVARVAEYTGSTLPVRGPGMVGRRFPQGTVLTPLPTPTRKRQTVANTPWQPYAAPYTGGGTPPDDWGLNFMVRPGNVWDGVQLWIPSMRNQVFTAPANCTGGFYGWLDATVDGNGKITALDYDSDTSLPGALTIDLTDSAPPPHAYCLLFILTSTATSVEWASVQQQQKTPLNLLPQLTGVASNGTEQARMAFIPASQASI